MNDLLCISYDKAITSDEPVLAVFRPTKDGVLHALKIFFGETAETMYKVLTNSLKDVDTESVDIMQRIYNRISNMKLTSWDEDNKLYNLDGETVRNRVLKIIEEEVKCIDQHNRNV